MYVCTFPLLTVPLQCSWFKLQMEGKENDFLNVGNTIREYQNIIYRCPNRLNRENTRSFCQVPKVVVYKGEKCKKLTEIHRK